MGNIIFKNAGDNAMGETIANGVILGLIGILNTGLFIKKGKIMMQSLFGDVDPGEKLKLIRATNFVVNLTIIASTLNRFYLGNKKRIKPAAVLAGIPLGTVEELSMALSDRILKFRSTGGVFLAHQEGGNETLRIVCKAWGIGRYLFLTMLDFVFMYGSAKILDLFSGSPFGNDPYSKEVKNLKDRAELGVEIRNPWKKFDAFNKDEGREEYHSTFPIVTKNRIYSSMYLETYDIVESVNNGMNMLTVTLFLRKYRPPYPLEFVVTRPEKKGQSRTAWYRQEKVKDKTINIKFGSLRWLDSIMDFGLSALILIQKFYMMMEYDIYNVEQLIALTFATHLDKSRGLGTGINLAVIKDKIGKITVMGITKRLMGVMI